MQTMTYSRLDVRRLIDDAKHSCERTDRIRALSAFSARADGVTENQYDECDPGATPWWGTPAINRALGFGFAGDR